MRNENFIASNIGIIVYVEPKLMILKIKNMM